MKKIFVTLMALCMILCAGCGNVKNDATTPDATTQPTQKVVPSSNEATLKPGTYAASVTYTSGEFSMVWNFTVTFHEEGTFTLVNDAGEEKGAGTWALTGENYTMTYSDDRTATFVVQANGNLSMTSDLPYGKNGISPDQVGGITLSYDATGATAKSDSTLRAGTYTASYTKESAMAGTVTYIYTAHIGEDGTFSYGVTFQMGQETYDGSAASGTYTLTDGIFSFTDSEGHVTEGVVTNHDTLVISLMASAMAKEPYEVTFEISE